MRGPQTGFTHKVPMNIFNGFCGCPDYGQHDICSHLLAAELQFSTKHGDMMLWSSAVRAPADADASIPVQRDIRAPRLPEGVQEPTLRFDPQRLTKELANAVQASRSSSRVQQLTEPQKAFSSAAYSLVTAAKQLPDEAVQLLLPKLQQLQAEVAAALPGFVPQRTQAKKHWRRQDKHRKNRTLFPKRNQKQQAAQRVLQRALH